MGVKKSLLSAYTCDSVLRFNGGGRADDGQAENVGAALLPLSGWRTTFRLITRFGRSMPF
jgi:hypothetical protein